MTAPRLHIDLGKVEHNARVLVSRLEPRGISVTGVTKATLGSPAVAGSLLAGGVRGLGDSRIENIEAMRRAGVAARTTLIRSPMLSQVDQVVTFADVSLNTEIRVIRALSRAAVLRHRPHGIVLMVELGDLREGLLPGDVESVAREVQALPNLAWHGIGTNLACQSGVAPDAANMGELSALAESLEATFGVVLETISGGNSANLEWAFGGTDAGRINDLRLGESILLGLEPLHRTPIEGLHLDAFTLVAEVIEAKDKPSQPWGTLGQTAFGPKDRAEDRGVINQAILALGRQDVDPAGLTPPPGVQVLGASSDHLIVAPGAVLLAVGGDVTFGLDYAALVRCMTSPFVTKVMMGPT